MASVTEESRPVFFSIERILGLQPEKIPGNCLKLHRPWTGEEQRVFNLNRSKSLFVIDEAKTVDPVNIQEIWN